MFGFFCRSEEDRVFEPLSPPEGSAAGDVVFVEGYKDLKPAERLNPKRKIWEKAQVTLVILL